MSWSIGEIGALAIKAARGAGMDWGMAQEVGWAVRWLCRSGHDPSGALVERLEEPDIAACPFSIGLRCCESGQFSVATECPVQHSLLSLPFIARIVPDGIEWHLSMGGAEARLQRQHVVLSGATPRTADFSYHGATPARVPVIRARIPNPDPETLSRLQMFAGRIYAPSTPESRRLGAGAGLNDSD